MIQYQGFALYEFTGPLIQGLNSMPKFTDKKFKNVLKNKEKKFDTIKLADNSSIKKHFGAGITRTDNEIKDIIKVIKSLENRGILLKGTNRKITSQEGGFLNFLRPLMTASIPLMKSVLMLKLKVFCYD